MLACYLLHHLVKYRIHFKTNLILIAFKQNAVAYFRLGVVKLFFKPIYFILLRISYILGESYCSIYIIFVYLTIRDDKCITKMKQGKRHSEMRNEENQGEEIVAFQ